MLNIEQEIIESLSFNLDQAIAAHQEALENHHFTVDIPAPTADPLVEAVVRAGGYAVIPRPEEPESVALRPEVQPAPWSDNPVLLLEELKALVQRAEQIVTKLNLEGNP